MRSATRLPSSSACSTTSSSSARRSASPIAGASRSTSTFVRSEVTGVRSSCEASATSWRCWACEVCRRASIPLKRAAMRPTSSWPSASMRRPRSPVASMCSAASVSSVTGATTRREKSRLTPAASAVPTATSATSTTPQALEHAVGVLERARHLDGADRAERRGEHAQVKAVDVAVGEAAVRSRRWPSRSGLPGHGQRRAAGGAELDRVAVGAHELRVAAGAAEARAAGVRSPGRPGGRPRPAPRGSGRRRRCRAARRRPGRAAGRVRPRRRRATRARA